ncbi:MAG: sulfurtransferase TusA family protein [Gammaproteobacteria bacterium]|nr:sulfurtransferase TusA family protein [Gammaproteobacteria bacterium]
MTHADHEIDLSGLNCPAPVMRSKKRLKDLASGEVLHVIATDPATKEDFAALMPTINCQIVEQNQSDNKFHFWIKKG